MVERFITNAKTAKHEADNLRNSNIQETVQEILFAVEQAANKGKYLIDYWFKKPTNEYEVCRILRKKYGFNVINLDFAIRVSWS